MAWPQRIESTQGIRYSYSLVSSVVAAQGLALTAILGS